MKKIFYLFAVSGFFISLASFASAASIFDITYPITELGGCASQQECKVYCDDLANKDACLTFAEKNGFIAKEKVEQAKKLPALGPGGCTSADECRTYCDNPDNMEECLAFAEKYGLKAQTPRGEEVSARAKLIREQGGPGNCQSQKECRAYCENPSNQKECLDFAEKHNLMDKKEIKAAKKVLEQGGPGGCRTEKECKSFCDKPENLETCLAFAEEHDLIDKKEAARARQMAGKPGPGGCVGAACKEYCADPDHSEECIKFAEENNLIPPGELERAKKIKEVMAQGGPGGCKTEKECREFCGNPDNFETCGEFAKKNNLMGENELKMMERGREMAKKAREFGGPGGCKGDADCRAYCEKPDHVEECLAFAVEQGGVNIGEAKDMLEKFARAGMEDARGMRENFRPTEGMPSRTDMMPPMPEQFKEQFEQRFQKFEQFRELEDKFRKPPEMMRDFQGPGGCRTPEECMKYCSNPEHRAECARVNPSAGALPPGEIFRQTEPGSERGFMRGSASTSSYGVPAEFMKKLSVEESERDSDRRPDVETSICPKEFRPVCGANNRTYPNKCFAENDHASVAKEGPCGENVIKEYRPEGVPTPEAFRQPPAGYQPPPNGVMPPPPDNFKYSEGAPIQPPQYVPQYTQPPAAPAPTTAPQSRRPSASFLSNLLQAFSDALRIR